MIQMYPQRPELKPDTRSFNTVIDCLAKSKEANCEGRAETLLERMDDLNLADPTLKCRPDQVVSSHIFHFKLENGGLPNFLNASLFSPTTQF